MIGLGRIFCSCFVGGNTMQFFTLHMYIHRTICDFNGRLRKTQSLSTHWILKTFSFSFFQLCQLPMLYNLPSFPRHSTNVCQTYPHNLKIRKPWKDCAREALSDDAGLFACHGGWGINNFSSLFLRPWVSRRWSSHHTYCVCRWADSSGWPVHRALRK